MDALLHAFELDINYSVQPSWPSGIAEPTRLFMTAKSVISSPFPGPLGRQADTARLGMLIGQMSVN
jgi:hypothetical protein